MNTSILVVVYFFYGLAFFSMGLAIVLEQGRSSDSRLRFALLPLGAFGFIHGTHEWLEMFSLIGAIPEYFTESLLWSAMDLALLVYSFLSLSAFGVYLLASSEERRRVTMLVPLGMAGVWAVGCLVLQSIYPANVWLVTHTWSRYVLGIPGALLASAGLISQQRIFRQVGLTGFSQDALWAAIAFAWYGLVGQMFSSPSPLPPSTFINSDLFLSVFGFPVQLLRASAAMVAAIFIIRVLRTFDLETRNQIDALRSAQLQEAQHRETLQRELFKRIVIAQEAERQRVGRELHDETGQALTAIGMGIRSVSTNLVQHPDVALRNLRQIEGMVAESINELQRLIADLRPSHLDDLGLTSALRWYGSLIHERTGINVEVIIDNNQIDISTEMKTAIFRIAQEALTNVIKHAQAKNIHMRLNYSNNEIVLQVKDDGRGFNMNILENPDRPSWGIIGMQERTALLGGHFHIFSIPGQGTLVEMKLPTFEEED